MSCKCPSTLEMTTLDDVVVWVDPLDATNEFAHVNVLFWFPPKLTHNHPLVDRHKMRSWTVSYCILLIVVLNSLIQFELFIEVCNLCTKYLILANALECVYALIFLSLVSKPTIYNKCQNLIEMPCSVTF